MCAGVAPQLDQLRCELLVSLSPVLSRTGILLNFDGDAGHTHTCLRGWHSRQHGPSHHVSTSNQSSLWLSTLSVTSQFSGSTKLKYLVQLRVNEAYNNVNKSIKKKLFLLFSGMVVISLHEV